MPYFSFHGPWKLFVFDDAGKEKGFINGGWSLTIETTPTVGLASSRVLGSARVAVSPGKSTFKGPELTLLGVGNGKLQLRVHGLATNAAYSVEWSEDLRKWEAAVGGHANSSEVIVELENPTPNTSSFFRVRMD